MATSLLGTSRQSLALLMQEQGEPAFRGGQIFRWIHQQRVADFTTMTNLPEALRDHLAENFTVARPQVSSRHQAEDGTCKWILTLDDGLSIETVYIPDGQRITLCLSSQVGCAYGCTFCATATMGKIRNLTTAEILGQVLTLLDGHHLAPSQPFNIVFMGMGEPMANLDTVWQSVERFHGDLGISARHITISTVGIIPGIRSLRDRPLPVNLAVSLHAANDTLRDELVPINRRYPIEDLLDACTDYLAVKHRRVSFEWAMIAGVNDRDSDARELAALCRRLSPHGHVNLIPLNPTPGYPTVGTSPRRVQEFRDLLESLGTNATVRQNRGTDIDAACGQLAAGQPVTISIKP
jgi:23S rRNA (adenine2503-C2)-methyltransferase